MKRAHVSLIAVALVAGLWVVGPAVPEAEAQSVRHSARARSRAKANARARQDNRGRRDNRYDRRDERREMDRGERRERRENIRDERQERWEDSWRRGYNRFERWEDWRRVRVARAGARLMAGMIFGSLPPKCTVVVVNGVAFQHCDGNYFSRVVYQGRVSYRVMPPPVGVRVTALPPTHTTVIVGGRNYYMADDVYYTQQSGGYVVVVPPH